MAVLPNNKTNSNPKNAYPSHTSLLSLPSAKGVLIVSVACLMVISLLMIASASMPFAMRFESLSQLHFFKHQLMYMCFGILMAYFMTRVPLKWIYHLNVQFLFLLATLILLVITLFGTEINGSKRWIEIGGFNFQTAEFAKLVVIIFTADFVVRRSSEVRNSWDGFLRILVVVGLITCGLLLQPDFGSVVIISGCVLTIFYIGGAPITQFGSMAVMVAGMAWFAVIRSDYRMARVMSFVDPFNDIQGSDYQLSRSLIAFGRGEWTGLGYGESVQKLSHLPEAHTDFLLAITGEEFGFFGVVVVLAVEAIVIASIMRISHITLKRGQMRLSYTAFGIGTMFIGQVIINAGMNMGLMPTKGLTMPFFSYGGSSLVVCLIMIGLLLRIYKESQTIDTLMSRNY